MPHTEGSVMVTNKLLRVLICSATTSGCAPSPDTSLDVVNPAAAHCLEHGGKLLIFNQREGAIGYCQLPNGRTIEEWDYYTNRVMHDI